mgnify:CR=1 FL=1
MTEAYEFFIKGQDKIVVTNVMKTINVAKIFFIIKDYHLRLLMSIPTHRVVFLN